MEDGIYECLICFEEKDPYSLPCGHNGCVDCLTTLQSLNKTCPECRKPIPRGIAISKNFQLASALELIRQMKTLKLPTPVEEEEVYWENLISSEIILKNVQKANWSFPTSVQKQVIPRILSRRNLLIESPNGTGKTGSFVLGTLMLVNPDLHKIQVISISHTKEIKDMHFSVFSQMAENSGIEIYKTERNVRPKSSVFQPHVLCGTLESVKNYISRFSLKLSEVCVVVDECDEILNNNDGGVRLLSLLEVIKTTQVLLYSATLSQVSCEFDSENGLGCETVSVQPPESLNPKIKTFNFTVHGRQSKADFIIKNLKFVQFSMCIIFVNTRDSVAVLAGLMEKGYKVGYFSGELDDWQREEVLENVKSGKINVLISTDVLGRGFDCRLNDLVINFDCPRNPCDKREPNYEVYFHRCGRTARNNRYGTVINLICTADSSYFNRVFARFRICAKIETDFNGVISSIEDNKVCYSRNI